MPNPQKVEQIKNLLELALILLALPWILYRLVTDPRGLMQSRESA